jgi:lysophospholipase L1-like esterase
MPYLPFFCRCLDVNFFMKNIFATWSLTLLVIAGSCQEPFEKEIAEFKKHDAIKFPPANANLFVGSSSFRLWKNLESDFPNAVVINRGFGGSTFVDLNRYVNDIVIPYNPKHVIVYCGDNDLANGDQPEYVLEQFKTFFNTVRQSLPAYITFVSIKPSPSRVAIKKQVLKTNSMIQEFLAGQKNAAYVDVYNRMIDADGNPREELFIEDRLHMNRKGYELWREALAPHLK